MLRRRRSLSLYRDTPEQRYLDFLSTQPKLLQRIPFISHRILASNQNRK
ncbi:hypothetical protein [Nostoc edaphicum]|nr:hypothetical protein [Nostoc edaphicum]